MTAFAAGLPGGRVLVTGAGGFIGGHLIRRLQAAGVEVHAWVRRRPPDAPAGVRWWIGDLTRLATVRDGLREARPDVIFHLAGHVAGSRDVSLVEPTLYGNLVATVNLCIASVDAGCRRIVLSGSLEEPSTGDAVPASPYAASKGAASAYARMFHALYGLPAVIARLFMVYGPAQRDMRKLVPYVIRSLLDGEPPRVSSGRRLVDWVYVEDAAEGLMAAAAASGVEGLTLDIGSGVLTTVRQVVEDLARLVGAPVAPLFGAVPDRPMEQVRVADTARTEALTGWRPSTPLADGLRKTVEWYRQELKGGRPGAPVTT